MSSYRWRIQMSKPEMQAGHARSPTFFNMSVLRVTCFWIMLAI
jgi:hypothetical protein